MLTTWNKNMWLHYTDAVLSSVKHQVIDSVLQIYGRKLDATQVHIIYKLIQAELIQTLTHPVIEYNYRWPSRHLIH